MKCAWISGQQLISYNIVKFKIDIIFHEKPRLSHCNMICVFLSVLATIVLVKCLPIPITHTIPNHTAIHDSVDPYHMMPYTYHSIQLQGFANFLPY